MTLTAHGEWASRLDRFVAMRTLIAEADDAELLYLQGDASVRRYASSPARLRPGAILMDWQRQPDGPAIRNGLPYSRLAHLAEDVRPFVAIGQRARAPGLTVPRIHAQDLDHGFLLIEDLGDRVFGCEVESGAAEQATLWRAATEALVALQDAAAAADASRRRERRAPCLRLRQQCAWPIETELLVDWYWPRFARGAPCRRPSAPNSCRPLGRCRWRNLPNCRPAGCCATTTRPIFYGCRSAKALRASG